MKYTAHFLIALSALLLASPLMADERQIIDFNQDWTIKPITQTKKSFVGDPVTLPHTWNPWYLEGTLKYNREMMVYQRFLEYTPDMEGKRLFLYFEGANSVCDLFVNHASVGSHEGGYTACCFEISDYLKKGHNLIEVWVSNAYRSDVLPISGDFNVCGGLHRPCHLIVTDKDCITPLFFASSGVLIHQDEVTAEKASLRIESILSVAQKKDMAIETLVKDAQGKTVASRRAALSELESFEDEMGNVHASLKLEVAKPHLWNGRKDPYLYTVTSSLLRQGETVDQVSQQTGFRYFKVDAEKGFFLNGQYLNLVGCCRHEDVEGKGSALTAEDYERDFELIRELGATAMRLAHYPHAEPMYNLADRDGIILMTEIPLCGPGGYGYTGYLDKVKDNARQQLQELVYQKFNHPSIVFWGIFNEILTNDGSFYQYDDPIPFIKELDTLYHQCDPSRLTTFATCVNQDNYKGCADLIAWNKYFGWYSDGASGAARFFDQAKAGADGKPVGVSEYGAGASIIHHQWPLNKATRPDGRFHPEEAQAVCHEGNWEAFSQRPWLWSKFVWVFADFPSSIRYEGDRDGINDKGLVTRDRSTKKDAFYFYKANWNDEPMVYIASRRFTQRTEALTDVRVYSNLASATLYVNGQNKGAVKKDNLNRMVWNGIQLNPGKNEIIVKGKSGKKILSDTCVWSLEGPQADPVATAEREGKQTVIKANPDNFKKALAQARTAVRKAQNVTVELTDGTYCLDEPLTLDASYSAKPGYELTFKAAEGAKPVISGGQTITNWTKVEGNLYKAPLSCDHKIRTLIVNGHRALIAQASVRTDGMGVSERFEITGEEPWAFGSGWGVEAIRMRPNEQLFCFANPEDVEIVQNKTWTEKILCLKEMVKNDDGSYSAHLQQPLGAILNSMAWAGKIDYWGKFHFRNAKELLDEPNEFYFDRSEQMIYYITDGADANMLDIVAPRSEGLIRLHGSSTSDRVSRVAFEGITFAFDAWNLMQLDESRGFGGIQSLGLASKYIPDGNWHPTKYNSCDVPLGCIDVQNASDIRIERCRFEHLGCASAICMTNDVKDARIVGNVFMDILGNSLTLGHPQHYEIGDGEGRFAPDVEGLCQDILVSNNYVRNVCLDFRQVETMVAFFVKDVRFLHNDIQYCPYGAISLGWWWGNANIPESTVAGNNAVSFNRIGNTHQLLSDGGPIYLLGRQPNSVIEGNYIFKSPRCIYPDDGSSGWDIHHNVVNSTYQYWLHIASDRDYDIRVWDNLVKDNALINDGLGVEVVNTVNFRNRDFNDEAKAIMEKAGIEACYQDIVPAREPEIMRIAPDFQISKW